MNPTFTQVLTKSMRRDYEYAPGIVVKIAPETIDQECFYPFNEKAEKVSILLTDGERLMDKFLFENLYQVSKMSNLFSEEDKHPLPFTGQEFDHFLRFVLFACGEIENCKEGYPAYVRITNFLVPVSDDLYLIEGTYRLRSLLENLDLDLSLLPYKMVSMISQWCDLAKVTHRRDLVEHFLKEPEHLTSRRTKSDVMRYINQVRPIIEDLIAPKKPSVEQGDNSGCRDHPNGFESVQNMFYSLYIPAVYKY